MKDWAKQWFYAPDLVIGGELPPFERGPPQRRASWVCLNHPASGSAASVEAVAELKAARLTGEQIFKTWVERRIQPLQARPTRMWEYQGVEDLSRVSPVPLSEDEVIARIQPLLKGTISLKEEVEPFSAAKPRGEVRDSALLIFVS